MPVCKDLRDDILEVRSSIKFGKVEARTYFSIDDQTMLLLHGHEGKDGQGKEIDLALERLKDHRQRSKTGKTSK